MSQGFKLGLGIIFGSVVLLVGYYPYSSGGRQQLNMATAEGELPLVRNLLAGDQRFADVRACSYTGQSGSLLLLGSVKSERDRCRLMQVVADLRLPVPIAWSVQIESSP